MGVRLRAVVAPTLDICAHRASHQRRPGQDKSAGLGNGGIKGICTKSDNNHQNLTTHAFKKQRLPLTALVILDGSIAPVQSAIGSETAPILSPSDFHTISIAKFD
jgi:hypothetical protein